MPKLWREASWISAAAAALLIALFSSRNGAGEQRAAVAAPVTVIAKTATAPASAAAEPDAIRQVPRTARELTDDLSRITARLAAVERSIDDLTGTVLAQNQPNRATSGQVLPAWAKDDPITSAIPAAPASGAVAPDARSPPADATPPTDAQADNVTIASPSAYGAEVGTAVSMKLLIARWTELRSAHPEVFDSLKPLAAVRDNPRTNRVELRLVVGPVGNRAGAAKLCAALAALRITCQPVPLDGQQVALQ